MSDKRPEATPLTPDDWGDVASMPGDPSRPVGHMRVPMRCHECDVLLRAEAHTGDGVYVRTDETAHMVAALTEIHAEADVSILRARVAYLEKRLASVETERDAWKGGVARLGGFSDLAGLGERGQG